MYHGGVLPPQPTQPRLIPLAPAGHSWQILWYGDCIWLILYGTGTPAGVCLAPLFSFAALLAALATQSRVAWTMGEVHSDLQAEGYDGEGFLRI